jgi:hypothetical protein
MAYELVAPPTFALVIKAGTQEVPHLTWANYAAVDLAGHHLLGFRVYRSLVSGQQGILVADESTLGPSATSFDDTNQTPEGTTLYYTVVGVEPNDFGARPFGEGGNVPFGA